MAEWRGGRRGSGNRALSNRLHGYRGVSSLGKDSPGEYSKQRNSGSGIHGLVIGRLHGARARGVQYRPGDGTGFFPDHRVEHLIIEVVGSDVSLRSDVDPSVEFPDGHAAVDLSHVGGTVEEHPGVPGLCSFQSFLSAAVGTDDASKFRIAGLVVLTRSGIALSAHPFKERSSSASDSVKPRKSNRLLIRLEQTKQQQLTTDYRCTPPSLQPTGLRGPVCGRTWMPC